MEEEWSWGRRELRGVEGRETGQDIIYERRKKYMNVLFSNLVTFPGVCKQNSQVVFLQVSSDEITPMSNADYFEVQVHIVLNAHSLYLKHEIKK